MYRDQAWPSTWNYLLRICRRKNNSDKHVNYQRLIEVEMAQIACLVLINIFIILRTQFDQVRGMCYKIMSNELSQVHLIIFN